MKLAVAIASVLILVTPSGSAGASDTPTFRGNGTAAVDGVLSPDEWDGAGRFDFQADRSPAEGGGRVPATLFVMNDSTNLYLALRVAVTNLGYSRFYAGFYPSELNLFGPGNDILHVTPTSFGDYYVHQESPNSWSELPDVADGGTLDGTAAVRQFSDHAVFEIAHPLDSPDDGHDFSLRVPSHTWFAVSFEHCVAGSCGHTIVPEAARQSKLVVVSGTHVPPETTITAGPAEGAEIPDYGDFAFAGTDDVAPPSEITFECSVDAGEWSECVTPYGVAATDEGWHTLSVRALDDMANVDPTPAERRWRIDTLPPTRPWVVRRGTSFSFFANDQDTPPQRLRFRCAIDAKRLHPCAARKRVRLPARRHVLRVSAVDPAGNRSKVRVVRFVVRRGSA